MACLKKPLLVTPDVDHGAWYTWTKEMGKWSYLGRVIKARFDPNWRDCPNCGGRVSDLIERKYILTELRRCGACKLMFRAPTDDPRANESYYENTYTQGFTTELPSDVELAALTASNFRGTERDYSHYITCLNELGISAGAKVFDFGCSWGYGAYQLGKAGFDVTAFEVARTRREFAARKLHVRLVTSIDELIRSQANTFDCFFSAHVLEHVPSPNAVINYAKYLLRPDGIFVSFTPNGSLKYKAVSRDWSKLWGEVHPNLIDDVFLDTQFAKSARLIGSGPLASGSIPPKAVMERLDNLQEYELFFAARLKGASW